MPCGLEGRGGGRDYQYEADLANEARRATRAACEMAALIRKKDAELPKGHKAILMFDKLSTKTRKWVRKHDAIDKKRILQEQAEKKRKDLQKKALAKLTKEERSVLNL